MLPELDNISNTNEIGMYIAGVISVAFYIFALYGVYQRNVEYQQLKQSSNCDKKKFKIQSKHDAIDAKIDNKMTLRQRNKDSAKKIKYQPRIQDDLYM